MIVYGQLTSLPSGDNLAVASVRGQLRPVFFNPTRFVATSTWFQPEVGDWVALVPGAQGIWHALNLLGKGTPTAEPPA